MAGELNLPSRQAETDFDDIRHVLTFATRRALGASLLAIANLYCGAIALGLMISGGEEPDVVEAVIIGHGRRLNAESHKGCS